MLKHDFLLKSAIMNAAGMLGFAPNARGPVALDELGAFITNPISAASRTPARGPRYLNYPGGILIHTGLVNPGLVRVLKDHARRWARASLPIIVHLIGETPLSISQMVALLEEKEGVTALELGLPPNLTNEEIELYIQSALGELPLIIRLPLDVANLYAELVIQSGCNAISLGPPRGVLPDPNGQLVSGRLYGPSLFPQGLAAVQNLASQGYPVIGSGGVYSPTQAQEMLDAGAFAVQLDTVLWRGPWSHAPAANVPE